MAGAAAGSDNGPDVHDNDDLGEHRQSPIAGSGGTLQVLVKLPSIETLATVIMVWFSVVQYGSSCVCWFWWYVAGSSQASVYIKTLGIVIMVWFSVVQYDGGCVCVGSGGTLQVRVKLPSISRLLAL